MATLQVTVNTDYNGRGIRDAQAAMTDLSNKTIQQLKDRVKDLEKTLNNIRPNTAVFTRYSQELARSQAALTALQRQARSGGSVLPTSMGGATSSVIEFNRVIQDAPFGIQGVGNNIQALTQNLAYLTAQTGSARKATSVFFSTLLTPANLAVLAVSAITTAWTIYARSQQGAASETKKHMSELEKYNKGLADFVETQSAVDRASSNAVRSTSEESTKLRVLYGVTQDLTMSLKARNRAADELQRLYPEQFKNQTNEAILTGRASSAYAELARNIIATGIAMAAVNLSAKNSEELFNIGLRQVKTRKDDNDLLADRAKKQAQLNALEKDRIKGGAAARDPYSAQQLQIVQLSKQIQEIDSQRADLADQRREDFVKENSLLKDQYNLQELVNQKIKQGADITGKPGANFADKTKSAPTDIIAEALKKSSDATDLVDLDGYKKELEKLAQEYKDYFDSIDKYTEASKKRGVNVEEEGEKAKTVLRDQYAKRRTQIESDEAERVSNEIQRIQNDFGVVTENNLEKDLANIKKRYDAEAAKANVTAAILIALEDSYLAASAAARQRYAEKVSAEYDKLADKIKGVEDQDFSQNKTGLQSDTDKITSELQKRIDKVNDLYDAMEKLNNQGLAGSAIIEANRTSSVQGLRKKATGAADSTDYQSTKALNQAIGKFTSDMYDNISNIGRKNAEITDKYNKAREGATNAEIARLNAMERQEKALVNSFGSIFSSIFDSFTSSMNVLFKQTLTNLLKTSFTKGLDDINIAGLGNKVSSALVAGAALAGNAISSIGGGKNTATSALGGALSGAASGAVLGSAIPGIGTLAGAVGGGLLGALGGIFGSASKRKADELQKQQLEEQKKTNAILDRQSRLSYSSQIVGRMTDRGVISAVDVNEFGQLTTTISGSDIVVSYDRTKKNQSRGL